MARFLILANIFLLLGSSILEAESRESLLPYDFPKEELSSEIGNEDLLDLLLKRDFPLKSVDYYLKRVKSLISPQEGLDEEKGEDENTLTKIASDFDWLPVIELAKREPSVEEKKRESVELGLASVEDDTEEESNEIPKTIPKDSPSFRHRRGFKKTSRFSIQISKVGLALEEATKKFQREFNLETKSLTGLGLLGEATLPSEEFTNYLQAPYQKEGSLPLRGKRGANVRVSKDDDSSERQRRQTILCPITPYRSMDGTCNNLNFPLRGAAFQSFIRILPPDYSANNGLRVDVNGDPLPNARKVSLAINVNPTLEAKRLSFLHMTYGQFIDHDLTSTPIFGGTNYGPISCCDLTTLDSNEIKVKHGCAVIDISPDDPTYSCHGVTCMDFTRSLPAGGNNLGPRQQLNQLSSYLDGSGIYGIPETSIDPLRTFTDGLLKMHVTNEGVAVLPQSTDPDDGCNTVENAAEGEFCFIAGDGRANEVLPLTFCHTLWAREHNRVARKLKELWGTNDDEELYQEARRIVVAELQHITYNEFLTTIIPHSLLDDNDMLPLNGGNQASFYQPGVDATIANSFAAAAYRFGHSLINGHMQIKNTYGTTTTFNVETLFFKPFSLYQTNAMSDIARGVTSMRAGKPGLHLSRAVTDDLFIGDSPVGLDLAALNIQRGRDHGIPGYTKFLDKCMGISPGNFDDLLQLMSVENKENLEGVYNIVDDIDLFVGGLAEKPLAGGILGPTLTCLILDQFYRLKIGDRFFYENDNQPQPFTEEQMESLHSVTLAKVMCNNIPELMSVQPFPLKNKSPNNPTVSCASITQYDLDPWA